MQCLSAMKLKAAPRLRPDGLPGAVDVVLAVLNDAGPCQSCLPVAWSMLLSPSASSLPVRLLFLPLALAILCCVFCLFLCFMSSSFSSPSIVHHPHPHLHTPVSLPFLPALLFHLLLLLPHSNFLSRVPDQDPLPSLPFFLSLFLCPRFSHLRFRPATPDTPSPPLPPSSDVLTRHDPDRVRGKETFFLAWRDGLASCLCAVWDVPHIVGCLSYVSLPLLYIRPSPVVLSSVFFSFLFSSSTQASFGFSLPIFSHSFFKR